MSGAIEAMDGHIPREVGDEVVLQWVYHPVTVSHAKTALLVLVLGLTALAVFMVTGEVGWSLVGTAIMILGVHDYLIPTRYRLTSWGAESRLLFVVRKRSWGRLQSYYPDANGVLLSPFEGRSRMEAHRGVYLRFNPGEDGDRAAALAFVRARIVSGAGDAAGDRDPGDG